MVDSLSTISAVFDISVCMCVCVLCVSLTTHLLMEWHVSKPRWRWNGSGTVLPLTTQTELEVYACVYLKSLLHLTPSHPHTLPPLPVTFYSCGRLGSNCAQCLSLDNHYRCTFCQSQFSCLLDDKCTGDIIDTVEDCPLPSIDSVRENPVLNIHSQDVLKL